MGAVFRAIPEIKAFEELACRGRQTTVRETARPDPRHWSNRIRKSTTLAAMIDKINRDRHEHILTIEDPIEFLHNTKAVSSISAKLTQTRTDSRPRFAPLFVRTLTSCSSEMRDLETIESALRIAETGHLTLATLHTNSAASTINRIIDVFPSDQQAQIRAQLSLVLEGILCQALLPRAEGSGRAMALEILVPNGAIRNLIREDKVHQIYSMMQTGQDKYGMQTFNQALATLSQTPDHFGHGAATFVERRRAARADRSRRRLKHRQRETACESVCSSPADWSKTKRKISHRSSQLCQPTSLKDATD